MRTTIAILLAVLAVGCGTVERELERAGGEVAAIIFDSDAELQAAVTAAAELAIQGNTPEQVLAIMESCASRCKHECGGINVAACFLNCSNHNCHPSCCGCKDGTAGCDGCGATCSGGDCGDDPQPVGVAARE